MPRTKPTTRKPPSKPSPPTLTIDLPGGGRATFRAEHELTPRHVRPLEELTATILPLIQQVTTAQSLSRNGEQVDSDEALPGPALDVTDDQAERMSRLNDLAVLAYLKSWTRSEPLPVSCEDLLDVPLPVYRALRAKAGELHADYQQGTDRFSVDSLPDDLDDADPDLPTSA